jgi:hypothetical protein
VAEVPVRDLVGLGICSTVNVQDKMLGISLRRRPHFKSDVVWDVFGNVLQSNAKFVLTDRLELHFFHVRVLVGNGKKAEKA